MKEPERHVEGTRHLSFTRSGQGPPVLLIHGLSGSRRWWRRNLAALESHFTVYRVELVGFGYASRQPILPLRDSASFLARWMTAQGLERAHVVGHSMGGHISLHLAERFPERVDRLVLVAPTGMLRGQWWRLALKLPQAAISGNLDFVPVVTTDALRAGFVNLYKASRELLRDDVEELLHHVRVPTLVVSGGRDVLVPPALGNELARRLGAHHVVYPHAGHVVMWDAPSEFNREVVAFLRGDDRIGAD